MVNAVGIMILAIQLMTQTVTQTRKRPGSIGRTQWTLHRAESAQKRREALQHNAFRRSSYLHTQEVTGSSPAVSTTKKPWNHNGSEVFSLPFSGRKEPLCLRYFGVFSGNFGASCCKSVANFLALYPLCHKGLRFFRQGRLLQTFSDGFLAECPTDFLSCLLLPIFTIIVGINTQRHVHRAVSSQILDLLYVQSSFKKTGDVSVAENMGS